MQHALVKHLSAGTDERRIPEEQHEARSETRYGRALDVVVAPDTVDAAEDGMMRTPAVPEEFDDCEENRQADARDHSEHRHADEADDGQPEFPRLDPQDATQIGELEETD